MNIKDYVSAEELKGLLSSLVVFIVAVTIFGLFGFLVVPGLRNANKPPVAPPVQGVVGETGWLDPVEYPPERQKEIPPLDPATVLEPTTELLAEGKALYEKNCTQCHGPEGRGDGPSAGSLTPPPRNFLETEGWKLGYGRPGIFKALTEGVEGGSMAAFDTLSPRKRMTLVHYVRSFGELARTPEDPASVDALSKQLAKAGQTIPNRIPVSLALEKLVEESRPVPRLELPSAEEEGEGAAALRAAVQNPSRVARVLAEASGWRDGAEELARIAVAGTPSNGFSVAAVTFGSDQWKALHAELIKRLGQ